MLLAMRCIPRRLGRTAQHACSRSAARTFQFLRRVEKHENHVALSQAHVSKNVGEDRRFSVGSSGRQEQSRRKQGGDGNGEKRGNILLGVTVCSMISGGVCYYYYYSTQERPAGAPLGTTGWVRGGGGTGASANTDGSLKEMSVKKRLVVPPEGFDHPMNSKPALLRWWLTVRRMCWLAFVFAPFAVSSGLLFLLQTKSARERWIASLLSALEAAGCSFQKFGQWMSMRPDMLPPDIIDALSKLRMEIPPHAMAHNERVVRAATGMDIDEIFSFFDPQPVASGTVAQVHRAVLRRHMSQRGEATEVAVKIRHPNVEDETFIDIDLIFAFMNTMGRWCGPKTRFTIPFKKEEFHVVLQRQIDFRWEAYNLERFCENFAVAPPRVVPPSRELAPSTESRGGGKSLKRRETFGESEKEPRVAALNRWRSEAPLRDAGVEGAKTSVCFPQVHDRLLSQAMLVESWAPGKTVQSLFDEVGDGWGLLPSQGRSFSSHHRKRKQEIAVKVYDCVMKMFLRDNCIHGDLHAGNVLFCPQTGLVTLIDTGVVCQVEDAWRHKFHQFLLALCTGDVEPLASRLLEFNVAENVNEEAFRRDMGACTAHWVAQPGMHLPRAPDGGPIMLGDLVGEMLFTIQRHRLHLRGDVASTIVEGLVKQLDPDFDVVNRALPYFVRYPPPSPPP